METTTQKVLQTFDGVGDVLQDDKVIARVHYDLRAFQTMHYVNGQEVEGLKDATAVLQSADGRPVELLFGREALVLRLDTGEIWHFVFGGGMAFAVDGGPKRP